MKLSKDPVKRAIRDNWYWPLMAEYMHKNRGEFVFMLPGPHPYDAISAEKCLKVNRSRTIYVDKSRGNVGAFNAAFPGARACVGDIFDVVEEFNHCAMAGSIALVDLDLCSCANPGVIRNLKRLRKNQGITDGCVVGLTICRRWKTDKEQENRILKALSPAVKIDQQYYTNSIGGAHMATGIYLLKG